MIKRIFATALAALMPPPCSSTISLAMARPRPAPPLALPREESSR